MESPVLSLVEAISPLSAFSLIIRCCQLVIFDNLPYTNKKKENHVSRPETAVEKYLLSCERRLGLSNRPPLRNTAKFLVMLLRVRSVIANDALVMPFVSEKSVDMIDRGSTSAEFKELA